MLCIGDRKRNLCLGEKEEMNVLVIPDIHLKPSIFIRAKELLRDGIAYKAVCLMDIPDDWNQQNNISLYEETFDAAISFAKEFPDTLWCYGNHDLSYLWYKMETGFSDMAMYIVKKKMMDLKDVANIKYVQRIDNILFSHGGISDFFVREHAPDEYENVDASMARINSLGPREMWCDNSPIWLRPQYDDFIMYKEDELLQVVGHTPVEEITKKKNVISTDVFSTYRDGEPIGNPEFLIINSITQEYVSVDSGLSREALIPTVKEKASQVSGNFDII